MNKTSLAKGTIYLTLSSGLFIVVGYLTNILLGRLLGPTNYGNYGVIVSLMSLINIIQTSGLTQSVAKYIAENEELTDAIMRSAFTLQIIVTGIISIIFFLLSPTIAALLHDKTLTTYLQLAAFSFPLYGIYALMIDYHNGRHFFKKQALLNSIYSVTKALSVISLGLFFQLKGVIWGFIIAPLTSLLFGFYYPKQGQVRFSYKKIILFSLPLIGYILFSTLMQSIDLYFVKALLSPESAGFYTSSQNISRILYFGTISFSAVLLPSISQSIKQKRHDDTQKIISLMLRAVILIILPIAALIAATSNQLISFLYSPIYLPASSSLMILVVSFSLFTLFTVICTILIAAGKPMVAFLLATIGLLLTSLFCSLFIPSLSIQGAALADMTSNSIVLCLGVGIIYRFLHIHLPIKTLIKTISISIILFILARVLVPEMLLLLPLYYLLLICLYFIMLLLTKELTKQDIMLIKQFKI